MSYRPSGRRSPPERRSPPRGGGDRRRPREEDYDYRREAPPLRRGEGDRQEFGRGGFRCNHGGFRGRGGDRGFDRGFDRGGPGRGRGGPGGGRGERRPHMGELPAIMSLVDQHPLMSDATILRVIAPPAEETFRDDFLAEESAMPSGKETEEKTLRTLDQRHWLPVLQPWRLMTELGVRLDNTQHIVRANFFRVAPEQIPKQIYQYDVKLYRLSEVRPTEGKEEGKGEVGEVAEPTERKNLILDKEKGDATGILKSFLESNVNWQAAVQSGRLGYAYDGRSALYTTASLHELQGIDATEALNSRLPYHKTMHEVVLTLVSQIDMPNTQEHWAAKYSNKESRLEAAHAIQALDVALMAFAQWQGAEVQPAWFLAGQKAFRNNGSTYEFGRGFLGRVGYFASLKCSLSGLLMVSDISVGCFLKGGPILEVIAAMLGYRSVQELVETSRRHGGDYGLPSSDLRRVEDVLKNCRVQLSHLGFKKKFKNFGPNCLSPETMLEQDNEHITIDEYFRRKIRVDARYAKAIPDGQLRYPFLPTIQVDPPKAKFFMPMELVVVLPGQSRQQSVDKEIKNNIIRYAAKLPDERFRIIGTESRNEGFLHGVTHDNNCAAFGLHQISGTPMKVHSVILPPPKLLYGRDREVEPALRGTWNLAGGISFAHPAPAVDKARNLRLYGMVLVYRAGDREPFQEQERVRTFRDRLEEEARVVGIPLALISQDHLVVPAAQEALDRCFYDFQQQGAQLVVALLLQESFYPMVKLAGDSLCLPTQCVSSKFRNPPRGFQTNILIKMNVKMGGVNHTLASRAPPSSQVRGSRGGEEEEETFQSPPKSISWLFDEPCMVMGVDVTYPEPGRDGLAVVAVVASMDGMLGQYAAHMTAVPSTSLPTEPVTGLEDAVVQLLGAFCQRNNGKMPRRIIIYRDGVADSQFDQLLQTELVAYKNALMLRGYDSDAIQMAIVVCQKRHHTRLVYQHVNTNTGESEFVNPCVGLCIDNQLLLSDKKPSLPTKKPTSTPTKPPLPTPGKPDISASSSSSLSTDADVPGSICTSGFVEFYLNSHLAVLGTSKPCKYVLVYDEILLKLSEIELLTFWMTHLYARCTRSVSYATPAYYAHWAALRGKKLLAAGATPADLPRLSQQWLAADAPRLYFL